MKKTPLYSASRSRGGKRAPPRPRGARTAPVLATPEQPQRPGPGRRLSTWFRRNDRPASVVAGILFTLAALWTYDALQPAAQNLTQEDLDAAVMHTWANKVMPSEATRAFHKVRGSVVMVRGLNKPSNRSEQRGKRQSPSGAPDKPDQKAENKRRGHAREHGGPDDHAHNDEANGVGTGVVLVDDGIILTNLHVVSGSPRIEVVFADGSESPARVIEVQRENDLAVLKALRVPENLPPATIRSTSDLRPGDKVIAVGFPFGIGPSVSSGIVSGLKREFTSANGKETLKNLIQFDASANPGNSGGPLVTMDGSVVGIVTGILNPSEHRTFAGIGFAVPIEQAAGGAGASPF